MCEDLALYLESVGYEVIKTSNQQNRYLRIIDFIKTILLKNDQYKVAYVEIYNGLAFIWAEISCGLLKWLGKPFIITLHGARLIQFSEKYPKRFSKVMLSADLVTTPSKLYQNEFAKIRPDIIYLPNAIDLSNTHFFLREKARPKIAWLRKFEHIYNPILAARTLDQLKDIFPEIKISMGGGDSQDGSKADVEELIKERLLLNNVNIPGFIAHSDKSAWFDNFDIFLNTTNVESFGIAVMEAAAAGLCIVTTAVGELPYLWRDGEDALLVPPDDAEAMAAAVERILTESGLAARLSANARKKAEQYDWSIILPKWEALFEGLMVKKY